MTFQTAIKAQQGAGVVGELALDGPFRGQPAILHSADATKNVVGSAATVTTGATGSWAAGSAGANDPKSMIVAAGGNGVFAGIIANPKVYALLGTTAGGPLASSLTLPNDIPVELITMGFVWVTLPGAVNVGDVVYYLTADGTLVSAAPAAAKPAGSGQMAIGKVERFVEAGAGLALISVSDRINTPAGS